MKGPGGNGSQGRRTLPESPAGGKAKRPIADSGAASDGGGRHGALRTRSRRAEVARDPATGSLRARLWLTALHELGFDAIWE